MDRWERVRKYYFNLMLNFIFIYVMWVSFIYFDFFFVDWGGY